jgi:hypothetical protein
MNPALFSILLGRLFVIVCVISVIGCREQLTMIAPPKVDLPPTKAASVAKINTKSPQSPKVIKTTSIKLQNFSPIELLGSTPAEVMEKLGEASLIRRERQSLILQYKKEECVLDVVLYGNNQNKRVKYTDLRDSEGKPAAVKHCYFKFRSNQWINI